MAAAFDIVVDTGGTAGTPGASTTVSTVRMKTADDVTVDSNNPIPIPTSGTNYSYWKHVYMKCTTAPGTKVDNVRFYTDGTGFGTGITVFVGDGTQTKNSGSSSGYIPATGVAGTSGSEMTASHDYVSTSTDIFATYTEDAPRTVSISEASAQIDAIGETTNYLVLQMNVASTASFGSLSTETMTFKYDEVA